MRISTLVAWSALGLLQGGLAHAGSGPWVLAKGDQSLYLGLESQRFTQISVLDEQGARDALDVGEGLAAFSAVGVLSYGVASRFEFELSAPWTRVHVNRQDADVCRELGMGACITTTSIGILSVRGKGLLLDELTGSPLSLSLGGEIRYGGLTANSRARLTSVGEGTTDAGAMLGLGRSGSMGQGFYSVFLDTVFRYRFPNTDEFPLARPNENSSVPGEELALDFGAFLAPRNAIAVGPSVDLLYRPRGMDFYDVDMEDKDRFSALRVTNLRAGAKLIVRDEKNTAFVVAAHRTVLALNNPSDAISVSAGVSVRGFLERGG